jgi:cyclic pyranopterin phosphate synthase
VLAGLRAARQAGFPLKLNAVLLAKYNGDQLADLVHVAAEHGAEPRFIELMPSGPGAALHPAQFLPAAEALRRLCSAMHYEGPIGQSGTSMRHRFRDDDRIVVVGFITPVSKPFCTGCDRLRLDARGRLFGCLRKSDHVDLAELLGCGDAGALHDRIAGALMRKSAPSSGWLLRDMVAIGG